MSDANLQPKTTPARKRAPRHNGRSGQKAYASENDAGVVDPYGPRNHAIPQTPDKISYGSSTHAPNSSTAVNAKQHNSNARNKNIMHQANSPDVAGRGRQSTPQRPTSMKAGMPAAYAGATFHASPAPSALPMPSFLSKAPNASPGQGGVNPGATQELSPPTTDVDARSPFRRASAASVPRANNESPLDFMFRAHKQEKEDMQRHGSSTDPRPPVVGSASAVTPSPFDLRHSGQSPFGSAQQARPDMRRSHSGIDSAELDGTPGQPIGPSFATPFQDRMRAARNTTHQATPEHASPLQHHQQSFNDSSDALKTFLFGGGANRRTDSGFAGDSAPPLSPRAPENQAPSAAFPPNAAAQGRPDQFHAMENDLRRILKIGSGPNTLSPPHGPFSPH